MPSDKVLTLSAQIWIDEDGIIHKIFLGNCRETPADEKENREVIETMVADKKYPMLVDFSCVHSLERYMHVYYFEKITTEMVLAIGGVTPSRISRVIGNFILRLKKPLIPGKLFNNQEDAIEWLKTFL